MIFGFRRLMHIRDPIGGTGHRGKRDNKSIRVREFGGHCGGDVPSLLSETTLGSDGEIRIEYVFIRRTAGSSSCNSQAERAIASSW